MVRLHNPATGVVVNVRDGKTLDGYVPVDEPADKPEPKATAKKAAAKPDDKK